ncbi:MAG TPA: SpoIIE family protein phosphatase [Terriglobales bacterium]|nr:SpoIIE family protein phosphatase [Terriglobales bacterium]
MEFETPEWLDQMAGILETLNEGVIIVDDCDHVIFVNACFEEMTEIHRDELLGKDPLLVYYGPEDAAIIQERRREARVSGRARHEFHLPTKSGTRLPVISSSRNMEDPDGRTFTIVSFTDISEQKSAEEQLRSANRLLEERAKEIEDDLTLAARVQQSLAPKSLIWGSLEVEAFYLPVRTIGGDFGLVSSLDNDHLNLLVCDVSGHGIGSALVANRIYSETITHLRSGIPLGDMLTQLNRFVMSNLGSSVFFFTVAAARVDRSARRMVFAGAGHPPAMIVKPGEEPRLLESRSMVLGALPNAVDGEATLDVDLEPGDRIVLYTDGITDVFDANGEMLGVEGVQKFVRETATLPFKQMKQGILDRVAAWREGPSSDDVSLVLVDVH